MKRYKIFHRTYYNFSDLVVLQPHVLRLRPRESHELRIESSNLKISPKASLRWYRDVEGNSVACATFAAPASQLSIESEVIIQHFNEAPLDFLVEGYARDYPFSYLSEDREILMPYLSKADEPVSLNLKNWLAQIWSSGRPIQTFVLLQDLCVYIHQNFAYQIREEAGVQTAEETLFCKTGSCRDFANLFIQAARHLGLATRFVSGYIQTPPSADNLGSTHAWAEVFLPGAGWKGFDPTIGKIVGTEHIAVAVSRLAESVPPIAGTFLGPPGATLEVGVWVSEVID